MAEQPDLPRCAETRRGMKQLLLDLTCDAPPGFDNFIPGDNAELLRALGECVRGSGHLYLWGPAGSGRSHLLAATVAAATAAGRPAALVEPVQIAAGLPETPGMLLAVDDTEQLDNTGQIALFNAFNRAAFLHQTLVLA